MKKPRIVIVDEDYNYLIPLQLKFVEEFFDKVNLEIITDHDYFEQVFETPQDIEILVVSEEFYSPDVHRHNIARVFVLMEQHEVGQTDELNITRLFKYTSVKEIFNQIVSKSIDVLNIKQDSRKEPQLILVYSSEGGTGKTTIALGLAACLAKSYKRVLYINAARLQTFQHFLVNPTPISNTEVYAKLTHADDTIYREISHVIRNEDFSYLPPFKASLLSLNLPYSVYEKIAVSAKKSYDFDYVIVDCDTVFDEEKTRLMNLANRVVIVTRQTNSSVYATNRLVENINGLSAEKYLFICNDFQKNKDNSLISPNMEVRFTVNDYIDHYNHYDQMEVEDFAKDSGMQRMSFLVM